MGYDRPGNIDKCLGEKRLTVLYPLERKEKKKQSAWRKI